MSSGYKRTPRMRYPLNNSRKYFCPSDYKYWYPRHPYKVCFIGVVYHALYPERNDTVDGENKPCEIWGAENGFQFNYLEDIRCHTDGGHIWKVLVDNKRNIVKWLQKNPKEEVNK